MFKPHSWGELRQDFLYVEKAKKNISGALGLFGASRSFKEDWELENCRKIIIEMVKTNITFDYFAWISISNTAFCGFVSYKLLMLNS